MGVSMLCWGTVSWGKVLLTWLKVILEKVHIDNLTVSWGKVLSLCCAGLRIACNTCVTFPSSYLFDNLGFLLREDLLMCFFTPCSWGSQQAPHQLSHQQVFWHHC